MRVVRSRVTAALLGALSWTATEYVLHRFLMHAMRGRGLASIEHLEHHADITYFSPTSKKLASAAGTTAVAFPVVSAIAGRRWATSFTAGLIGTYFAYEVAHRRIHTHPPVNRYGRWSRRQHLHHHFGAPMRTFGVTTPWWDRLLRTDDEPGTITVPRRMAPAWLLDDNGEVRPELAQDYRVTGRSAERTRPTDADRNAAFANLAPQVS